MGLKLGITMLLKNKDDIQFVTEFPCLLGHPVHLRILSLGKQAISIYTLLKTKFIVIIFFQQLF